MSDDIPTNNLHDLHDAWLRDTRNAGLRILGLVIAWLAAVSAIAFVLGWALA